MEGENKRYYMWCDKGLSFLYYLFKFDDESVDSVIEDITKPLEILSNKLTTRGNRHYLKFEYKGNKRSITLFNKDSDKNLLWTETNEGSIEAIIFVSDKIEEINKLILLNLIMIKNELTNQIDEINTELDARLSIYNQSILMN
jgi:hypothetical protein